MTQRRTSSLHRASAGVLIFLTASALGVAALGRFTIEEPTSSSPIRVVRHTPPAKVAAYWASLPERHPPLRGYRAPIAENAGRLWPIYPPDAQGTLDRATRIVAERLAIDGLPLTLTRVMSTIDLAQLDPGEEEVASLLQGVGLPVDLLAYFQIADGHDAERYPIIRHVRQLLATGRSPDELSEALRALPFEFRKTSASFRAASESGEFDAALVRLQMPRGDYWRGIGDGSGLDVCRQLLDALPEARFLVSIESAHLRSFMGLARWWMHEAGRPASGDDARMTVVAEALAVAEWTQDNGKAGVITSASDGMQRPATLAPRYANRGEEGTVLVPGENLLLEGLRVAGHSVIQSPLLFQGGNLILGVDPHRGFRYLLIGEAEIHRNTALGLTLDQVYDGFAKEFDASVIVTMHATSYHIDYDVSLRSRADGLTAFVNDRPAAIRIILRLGAQALHKAGVLDPTAMKEVLAKLDGEDLVGCADIIRPLLEGRAIRPGQYPESLAAHFSTGLVDPGVGNFQHFLLALDLAAVKRGTDPLSNDVNLNEYLSVFRRRSADRDGLRFQLEELGIRVVPIPSLAEGERSLNYLNGIHTKGQYLMPAYGGFYSALDQAAFESFRRELGNEIEVKAVYCAESQRRYGALRCATAVYPAADAAVTTGQ